MQRILVVDDVEINRDLLCTILEDEYTIETAENGKQALHRLRAHDKDTAAVLLDLQMPEMDGFTVITEMKKNSYLERIPVLIISSEHSAEVESRCLELGVSDFIHKPFDSSIVRNRVKNTIELFERKNELGRKVEEQEEALRQRDKIIQIQAGKLKEIKAFNRLMMEYRFAIMEVETRLKVLNEEFSHKYKRNPFESIKSRLKSPESIYEKLERKGYPVTVENIREHLTDIAGLRVICSFPDDIYNLANLFTRQGDIVLLKKKDYIKCPKESGYRSLHLILSVPVFLSSEIKYVKAEIQFRTIAMDFWASLEHKIHYKFEGNVPEHIKKELIECANMVSNLDSKMLSLNKEVQKLADQAAEEKEKAAENGQTSLPGTRSAVV